MEGSGTIKSSSPPEQAVPGEKDKDALLEREHVKKVVNALLYYK